MVTVWSLLSEAMLVAITAGCTYEIVTHKYKRPKWFQDAIERPLTEAEIRRFQKIRDANNVE